MALDAVEGEHLCKACKESLRESDQPLTCRLCGEQYPLSEELS